MGLYDSCRLASCSKSQHKVCTAIITCHAFNMSLWVSPTSLIHWSKWILLIKLSTHNMIVAASAIICKTFCRSACQLFINHFFSSAIHPWRLASCKKIHHAMHATMVLSKMRSNIPSSANNCIWFYADDVPWLHDKIMAWHHLKHGTVPVLS